MRSKSKLSHYWKNYRNFVEQILIINKTRGRSLLFKQRHLLVIGYVQRNRTDHESFMILYNIYIYSFG